MTNLQHFQTVPTELKSLRRWVLWRIETRDGRLTKVPYQISGQRADATKAETWADFETVVKSFNPKQYAGIGYVLTKADGICCIDLDAAIDDSGNICPEAMQIVEQFNSWTEVSQSGKGLHIFVKGTKKTPRARTHPKGFDTLEIYDDKRFIALTFNWLKGTSMRIEERQAELDALCAKYFSDAKQETPPPPPKQSGIELTDEQIIALCRRAKNSHKFEALFDRGDISGHNNDESSADVALCMILAFYTDSAAQIESIFSRSALGRREKWIKRDDYRRNTIRYAIDNTKERYTPQAQDKYPLQRLNPNAPMPDFDDGDDEDAEETTLEIPNPQSLLFTPTMREIYEVLTANDPPESFALIGTISVIQAILGDCIKVNSGNVLVKTNDFHVIVGDSGVGKSTVLDAINAILSKTEDKLRYMEYDIEFTIPSQITEKGLKDMLRNESESEKRIREELEQKGKQAPPIQKARTGGLMVTDEFLSLLIEMKAKHSGKLLTLLLQLWQGQSIKNATSKKNDGFYKIPETSISLIGAITLDAFWRNLPPNSESNGFFSRLNLVWSEKKSKRRSLISLITDKSANPAYSIDALAEKLADLRLFVSKQPFTDFEPDCTPFCEAKNEELKRIAEKYASEAIGSYANRIEPRLLKYALLIETVKAFETGRKEIIVTRETAEQAAKLMTFLVINFINFVSKHQHKGDAYDTLGRIRENVEQKLKAAGEKGLTFRDIYRKVNASKEVLKKVLTELIEAKVVESYNTSTPNKRGRRTEKYRYKQNNDVSKKENCQIVICVNSSDNSESIATNREDGIHGVQEMGETNILNIIDTTSLSKCHDDDNTAKNDNIDTNTNFESKSLENKDLQPEKNVKENIDIFNVSLPSHLPDVSEDKIQEVVCALPKGSTFPKREIIHLLVAHFGIRAFDAFHRVFPKYVVRVEGKDEYVYRDHDYRPNIYKWLVADEKGEIPGDGKNF